MLHARLVLLLTLAPMACALRRRPNLIVSDRGGVAARGGADADADGGSLFGGDEADGDGLLGGDADADGLLGGDDADAESEEDATKRYAAAVKAAREQGGDCPALDAFEAESKKPDRDEALMVVHWMDVKLQNVLAKKPSDYAGGDAFNASHPYSRGVAFLATECGAYVEAEKITADAHKAFCGRCADALDVGADVFETALATFEAALGKELHESVGERMKEVRAVLEDEGFAAKAFASLTERESKILEMINDVDKVEGLKQDMLKNLVDVGDDSVAQASMLQQIIPAVEALLGARLMAEGGE